MAAAAAVTAAAVPMAVFSDAAPGSFLDDSQARTSAHRRNTSSRDGSTPRHSLRRSRSSLENLQKKRAQQSRLPHDRPKPKGGQQFRVGNVTSNGRLQLRPVARDAHSHVSPPITPPYAQATRGAEPDVQHGWRESLLTGSVASDLDPLPQPRADIVPHAVDRSAAPPLRLSRARSHSFSTFDDPVEPDRQPPPNIKVLVNNASPKRTRTATNDSLGLLEIAIPHYRLGTPHFSGKGSAILHSSINTGSSTTEGFRSSAFSTQEYDRIFPQPPNAFYRVPTNQTSRLSRPHYLSVDGAASQRRTVSSDVITSQAVAAEPTVLLELEASPLNQNSRSLVRLSQASGQILAATPSGLIAQITSPNLLDYELLSDFFLTFRSYLSTHQLVGFLITRLQWAVSRSDDFGRIVRVRTFVALRHWILNYFVDDFVADYSLRSEFCNLVNDLCYELRARLDGGAGDLKILGELKKCWRRTCALYWDVLEHKNEGATDLILPGGRLGSRESSLGEKSNLTLLRGPAEMADMARSAKGFGLGSTAGGSWFDAQPPSHALTADGKLSSASQANAVATSQSQNRISDQSAHVVSCSITFKSAVNSGRKTEPSTGARPAAPPVVSAPSSARLSPGLRKNSPPYHRRAGSFSDALRDHRTVALETSAKEQEPALESTHPLSGSLVRGALIPPTSPYVEYVVPESPIDERSRFEFNFAGQSETNILEDRSQAASSPGVKRFLGNFRRALSTRQNLSQTSIVDRKGAVTKRSPRLSGIPISRTSSHGGSGAPKRKLVDGQIQPRVDLLAVAASESFFRAAEEENEVRDGLTSADRDARPEPLDRISTQQGQHLSAPAENRRILSDVTMGSRSIVIVDDTGEYSSMTPRPITHGSRAPNNSWIEDFHNADGDENRETIKIGVEPESPMANRLLELGVAGIVTPPSSSGFDPPESNTDAKEVELVSDQPMVEPDRETDPPPSKRSTQMDAVVSELGSTHKSPPIRVDSTLPGEQTRMSTADSLQVDRQPQLRRRPGGDLRAVDHVHSLDEAVSQRSFRSSTTDSQVLLGLPQGDESTEQPKMVADEQSAPAQKKVSIMDTHSSQPMLRASFEKEVAKLAQLPDNGDDGGIESTLRKLEGHLQASDAVPFEGPMTFFENQQPEEAVPNPSSVAGSSHHQDISTHPHREEEIFANTATGARHGGEETQSPDGEEPSQLAEANSQYFEASSATSFVESNKSDSSTPLLERGMSYAVQDQRRSSSDWLKVSLPKSPTGTPPLEVVSSPEADNNSGRQDEKAGDDGIYESNLEANVSRTSNPHKSFLLDDNQSLTGVLHDALGAKAEPSIPNRSTHSFFNDKDDTASLNYDSGVLPHPLRHPATPPREKRSPFTPQQSSMIPGPSLAGHITQRDRDAFSARSSQSRKARTMSALELEEPPSRPALSSIHGAAHMPFILGFDSLLLAQQFTLVEKDALSEIDWRQLIDLQWNTNAGTCRTWADCLRPSRGPGKQQRFMGGVDLCITRFNIAVKWATSEIVLCQDLGDRVACIVKYIHIARHARQLRNWSTMFQITMALVSGDIARLKETWKEVPESEREYLKTLETLITPTRNFYNLREEIEMAVAGPPAPGTDGGCIPFIGIYTHDLIYNSQKPEFAQQPHGFDSAERLINFERHRTAATIVKALLRLVDASSKYPFQPIPDVLSRCLWMATLPDVEISQRSKMLEP